VTGAPPGLRERITDSLLADRTQSDRAIARALGCSKGTVAKYRTSLPPVASEPGEITNLSGAGVFSNSGERNDTTPPQDQDGTTALWTCAVCSWRQRQPGQQRCEMCSWNPAVAYGCLP
jgi:hypothetical protein